MTIESFQYLQRFHPISKSDFEALGNTCSSRRVEKDTYLILPGEVQREVLFVRSGVQMAYLDNGGKLHVVAFTYPPNLCAIPQSFFFQSPSSYALRCLSDSEFDVMTFENLQRLFDTRPAIERLFRKMTESVLAGVIDRHLELHALSIEQRFRKFCSRSAFLLNIVPHKYLASYLAIDPTNFSKLFNSVRV